MPETAQQYTQRILGHVEGKKPLAVQRSTPKKLAGLVARMDRKRLGKRPEADKWSIAEILAHLADTELVISWRLRQILCSNGAPIQAYDQNAWAATFKYGKRDPKGALNTFRMLRENNLTLLKTVSKELWDNYGMHEERGQESIGRIVEMVAGHDLNHIQQVERIVKAGRKR